MESIALHAAPTDLLHQGVTRVPVQRVRRQGVELDASEALAVEEPLEIRLTFGPERHRKNVAVTMRTPGQDGELALGFLYGEGVIGGPSEVRSVISSGASCRDGKQNVVEVELQEHVRFAEELLERHFYTTSSCGVCGKTSIAALQTVGAPELRPDGPVIAADTILRLPDAVREAQQVFEATGGLHAAALFTADGTLQAIREDVGRHNALDKLVGASLLEGTLPLSESIVLVSGRASFELVQKTVRAGIPVMAAVGAPSSLAVDLASSFGMTLAGFVRGGRFNLYCGRERIV